MDSELTDQQTNINKAIALALADFYSTKTPPKKPHVVPVNQKQPITTRIKNYFFKRGGDVTTITAEIKKSPLDEEHYMNVSVDNPNNQTTDEFINELINGNDKSLKIYESKYEKSPMIPAPPTPTPTPTTPAIPAITSALALASV
jgi:hypothetical protein